MKIKSTSLLGLSVIAISTLFFASSCKKSNSGASGQLSATVNGTSFQPSLATAIDEQGHILVAGIQVISGDTVGMTLSVPDTAKAGSLISLGLNYDDIMTFSHSKTQIAYDTYETYAHGTINVSTLDKTNKKVAGSFTATLYNFTGSADSVKVTGQFNTTYLTY